MLILISPAKTLDFESTASTRKTTQPVFLDQAENLIDELRTLSPQQISKLMHISDKLGSLNFDRFQSWQPPFDLDNAKQAAFAFKGDVYTGLNIETLSANDLSYAQKHLRILSGLYGLLRPLDLIQPYRLEMGTKFANQAGANLYEFWGDTITNGVNKQLKALKSNTVINLASNEYFKAIKPKLLNAEIITPVFKDEKNGKHKIISFYAKKARGLMSAFIIQEQPKGVKELKAFDRDGYYYSPKDSTATELVFLRDEQ